LQLEDIEVNKISMEIGELAWKIVSKWEYFEKKILESQFVSTADSIAFNISEGYGRVDYRKNKNFCYYSRGSAKEMQTAVQKAKNRHLLTEEEFQIFTLKFNSYFKLMYGYINSIGKTKDEG
jgi:four helix bundle protein